MIESKEDYLFYLEADKIALRRNYTVKLKRSARKRDKIWEFQRLLRKAKARATCFFTAPASSARKNSHVIFEEKSKSTLPQPQHCKSSTRF